MFLFITSEAHDTSLYADDLGDFKALKDYQEPEMIDLTPVPKPVEQREPPPLEFTLVENASGRGKVSEIHIYFVPPTVSFIIM